MRRDASVRIVRPQWGRTGLLATGTGSARVAARAMRGLVATVALLAGCSSTGPVNGVLTGPWGGDHLALVLSDSGGSAEYDCAHGGLSEPIRPTDGTFTARGVHVREHGGPVREGETPDSLPARYFGFVRGDLLTLRVLVGSDTLGPFTVRRGAAPRLMKCL